MGACASGLSPEDREAIDRSRRIDQAMVMAHKQDLREDQNTVKLLLLGAGESGKSTILKQMKILYGTGFAEDERTLFRKYVWANLIETFKVICEGVQILGIEEDISAKEQFNIFLRAAITDELTPSMGLAMQTLWVDPVCREVWNQRSKFQVIDAVPTYLQRIPEIASPTYIPSVEDVLLARVRSTGISEEKFIIDEVPFMIFDVGGQRNERKKWIHCFDEVSAVIFVAALSEFDQKLFEDDETNRMSEAINLFDQICNSRWFASTAMILFLNKDDLFQEKINSVDISTVPDFSDYMGNAHSYEEGIQYFLNKFVGVNKRPEKDIFHHVTCGIDTAKFAFVFSACKEIILKQEFAGIGFAN